MPPTPETASLSEHLRAAVGCAARDAVERALLTLGLRPADHQQRVYRARCRRLGRDLESRLLPAVLGETDSRDVREARAFGAGAYGLAPQLPPILWFGRSIGAGLHAHLGGSASRRRAVGDSCATFNVGIVMFDRICDRRDALAERLRRALDSSAIGALAIDPPQAVAALAAVGAASQLELRIVLKLVCAFYCSMWRTTERTGDHEGWRSLNALLAEAYQAELDSIGPSGKRRCAAAQRKSTLPFAILLQAAALGEPGVSDERLAVSRELSDSIAELFWLLDDLNDLGQDLRSGDVNSILCDLEREHGIRPTEAQTLHDLLDGGFIERAGHRLEAALATTVTLIRSSLTASPELASFLDVVTGFACGSIA